MTQEKVLEQLKKDVRSLLMSVKGGLAIEQLKKDYQKMLGHPLPLVILGYRDVMDMVQDMPDVVTLSYSGDGTLLLNAVGNEATKGIENLVAKQRKPKPKGSTRKVGSGLGYHHHTQEAGFILPRRGQPPPAVPAQLRSELRQLLSQGPVVLSELEARFLKRFGRPLQVMHYGFYSFAEMLAALSDFVAVEQGRRGSLVFLKSTSGSLKHPQVLSSPRLQQRQTVSGAYLTQGSAMVDKCRPLSNQASKVLLNNSGFGCSLGDGQTDPEHPLLEPKPTHKDNAFENCFEMLEEQLKNQIFECGTGGTIHPELKEKLRQVVAQSSEGVSIHELPGEFKRMFGEDLPVAQYGFLSVTEMVGSLSDMLYLKRGHKKEENHWIVMDLRHINQGKEEDKESNAFKLSENVNTSGNDNGCHWETPWEGKVNGLPSSEDTEIDTDLKVANKSFHQVVAMFPSMSLLVSGGGAVPLDALYNQKLPLTATRRERSLAAVLVERVESPNHFYIRFYGNLESRTLENMMFEMRNCYTCPEISKRYQLPESFVQPGQVCCLAPRGIWFYRVIIHRVLNDTQVEVYYVDYGDLSITDWRNLKLLKSCYSGLPAQAVPSSLIGVQPISGSWSKSAISYFQKFCCERPLVSVIHSYHEDILHMFLCDTHTKEDLYIHTALLAEGHALQSPASNSKHISILFNPVTLYLETGLCKEGLQVDSLSGSCSNQSVQSVPCAWSMATQKETNMIREEEDIPDLPDLEFIDIDQVTQIAQTNPFGALLCKELLRSNTWEQGCKSGAKTKTEVNQSQTHGDEASLDSVCRSALEPELLGASPVGEAPPANPLPPPVVPPVTQLAGRELAQAWDYEEDARSPAALESTPSFMLSFFAASSGMRLPGYCLQNTPSSFLGSAARLATGMPFLSWYRHKAP